ncbi:MAG: GNAT family N-acetyltransferase [Chloroflexota bacterium]|nr:GNAT family N-acetyltransferase [Chloroflexota bacterium]
MRQVLFPRQVETARLRLRRWEAGDADAYARICADPEVMRYVSGRPLTLEECRAQIDRFLRHWEERGFGPWAVERRETGAFIGRIGLLYQEEWTGSEDKVEVGWLLDRRVWGQGLATESAAASLYHGFVDLRLPRIISIALPANAASLQVMKMLGLARQGEWRYKGRDVVWYSLDRATWERRTGK